MFADYVFKKSFAHYYNRVLLIDSGDFRDIVSHLGTFHANGFEIVHYTDNLFFRVHHERQLKSGHGKMLVIAPANCYIPFDIRAVMHEYSLSMKGLFPRLNSSVLLHHADLDLDLLCCAYQKNYEDLRSPNDTERFLDKTVHSRNIVLDFIDTLYNNLMKQMNSRGGYQKWFYIAAEKARIDVLSVLYSINYDTSELNALFTHYILKEYGKLSVEMSRETPVMVSRVMEFMAELSRRFILIVMDGMSEFDWRILSNSFHGISYHKTSVFAMIPTVTSVSRQCLLSNKFPSQLKNPWKQTYEKSEFTEAATRLGYADYQIGYGRGYDVTFPNSVQCGVVIINDVDDLVHGQTQGRIGMLNDVAIMAKQSKLASMVQRFRSKQYDVFITADHGNTVRTGIGRLIGTGVETETKSHCMLVLHDYAEKNKIKSKYNLIEFPKYYLPKEYDYLLCNNGESFDIQGMEVMTHGGISLDECIVPFIKILAVDYHG